MKVDAQAGRAGYKTLPKKSKQRGKGYLWIVERRIDGKRKRRFFRNGEADERDAYIAAIDEQIDDLAKEDRGILANHKLLEQVSRAAKELAPYGKTVDDAVSHYVSFLKDELARNQTPVKEVIDRFLKSKEGKSERHYRDLKSRLGKFEEFFGEVALTSITEVEIEAWIRSLDVAAQTQRNYRTILTNLFNFALRKRILSGENPLRFVETDDVDEQEIETISVAEVKSLVENASPQLLPAIVLMAFCGLRNSEIVKKTSSARDDLFLDWSKINFKSKTITVIGKQAKKTKRRASRRVVTIPDNALAWLKPIKRSKGRIADFATADLFNHALGSLRAACGYSQDWPHNALRKTFISCHYASYRDEKETAAESGSSPETIKTYYLDLIDKAEAKKLWRIKPKK
ncbi:hypothetical protein N9074_01590 [Akkermansiaceae bacterium]|nr:hypothetical protein [Akkermansiaceae bacterium]MDB4522823.1 hypothetical protein [Akkermansiaceae bacterium]